MQSLSDSHTSTIENSSISCSANAPSTHEKTFYSTLFGSVMEVDIVPEKTCPGACVHCSFGNTACQTIERESFYPVKKILRDVESRICANPRPHCIVLGGRGEPTLHAGLC